MIKFSIIAFALLFSAQFVKAQSISIGASFGYGYRYPHTRIIVADNYPDYGYYDRPVYYGRRAYYARPVYYDRPYYADRYYGRRFHYHHRHFRHW
ncbi:MAG: hypothetical protein JWR38_5822 [Mucilaginibacter sp.]|nr:hypothetical protein [Mucilaginibacter sp.]